MFDLPRIIGLCGDIGSGKDTAAEGLNRDLGYWRLSFAQALKETAATMFPWLPRGHFFGTQAEKSESLFLKAGEYCGLNTVECWTGRQILEELGTVGRRIFPDVWVKAAMEQIDRAPDDALWVISDVRYPNEFEAIRERGGVVWEVVRTGGPPAERSKHSSDNEWRTMRKDARLEMPWGHVDDLRKAACELARNGGRLH